MRDTIFEYLTGFMDILRPANLIDVLFAACYFYAFLWWLRQSTSPRLAYRIVAAAFILAALYETARRFEMVLLEMLVMVSFLLVGLGTAVFYQKNIQRTLDRLLLVRFRHPSSKSAPPLSPVEIVCEAVDALVTNGHGALIAIRGKDAWSRHIEGGVRLEGFVSVPLLLSLFDPNSIGHDGAVLIEGEVVTHFGAHLPLSATGAFHGTRHAAGLGLSERCDAFVIIVSEESGSISIAKSGKLGVVASAAALEGLLAPFWEDSYATFVSLPSRWKRTRHLTAPLLSLVLAVLLWLLFGYRPEEAIQTFTVPIEYVNVPPHLELVNPIPVSALVTLSGSEQAIRVSEPSAMIISIDLSEIIAGTNRLAISESSIQIPPGWTLYSVAPSQVVIQARPRPPPEVDY